jgi:hypothetical protein
MRKLLLNYSPNNILKLENFRVLQSLSREYYFVT